jgi:xanthine dehydrogenase accessory factor
MSEIDSQIARAVVEAAQGGASVAVATVLRAPGGTPSPGHKLLVRQDGSRLGSLGGGALEDAVARDCHAALTRLPRMYAEALYYRRDGGRAERADAPEDAIEVMIEVTERPASVLIVGGGHVGQALATVAAHTGFSVAVIDDREAFANQERFPMAERVICGDVEQALREYPIDATTYVVLVSRGHKVDEVALRGTATRGAAYVGMIGSVRRVSTVLTHLAGEGVSREALERVHTPIGLDIGAETPEEIAVSIMAELVLVRRGGSGQRLSQVRKARIRG